jgi:hypothetical protein
LYFYAEKVYRAIFSGYQSVIASAPTEGGVTSVLSVSALPPVFVRKEGERVFFETQVKVAVQATTTTYASSNVWLPPGTTTSFSFAKFDTLLDEALGREGAWHSTLPSESSTFVISPPTFDLNKTPSRITKQLGFHSFLVRWHGTYTASGDLTNPKLDSVERQETEWEEG